MDDYVCLWLMIQLQKGAHTILSLSKSICGHRKYLNVNCLAYILLTVEALISPGRLKFSLTVIILVEYSTIKLRCRGWHSSDCTSEKNETRKQPPTTTRSQARDPPCLTRRCGGGQRSAPRWSAAPRPSPATAAAPTSPQRRRRSRGFHPWTTPTTSARAHLARRGRGERALERREGERRGRGRGRRPTTT